MPVVDPPSPPSASPTAVLHVCVTCRAGEIPVEGHPRPGRRLFDRLRERTDPTVEIRPVECLARCSDGCAAAITAPGKWSLLMGRLDEGRADDLLHFAAIYRESRNGTVMPSRRPASLGNAMLGRIPGLEQGSAA